MSEMDFVPATVRHPLLADGHSKTHGPGPNLLPTVYSAFLLHTGRLCELQLESLCRCWTEWRFDLRRKKKSRESVAMLRMLCFAVRLQNLKLACDPEARCAFGLVLLPGADATRL